MFLKPTGHTFLAMPRCHIHHKPTGTTFARDLYQHGCLWLLDVNDGHEMLPAGSFVRLKEDDRFSCRGEPAGSLLLGCESLLPLPRGDWEGCCGPSGDRKNVLALDGKTPMAWEVADCYTPQFICVDPGEWELEQVGHENGVCWVAWIEFQGERQLLRAAYGRDEAEAKARLIPAAQKRLEEEAACDSHPEPILNAKIEMADVEEFVGAMGGNPRNFQGELKWLFRKYSSME